MLLNVQRTGGVFRHYQGLDRPPSLINLKRVDHDPGLIATPHSEVENQERALSVQYNTTSPSTCPPPELRSRPVIGDRFNTSGTPGCQGCFRFASVKDWSPQVSVCQ